jgi:hypothetical protein
VLKEKVKFVYDQVERLNREKIDGDLVECGVFRGGLVLTMAMSQIRFGTERDIWLFDTFRGLTPPSKQDGDAINGLWKKLQKGEAMGNEMKRGIKNNRWNWGPRYLVERVVSLSMYPPEKIHFLEGDVSTTLRKNTLPEKIAYLRLDTDWFQSSYDELLFLMPRMSPGGIVEFDDYCGWEGQRKATNKYFSEHYPDLKIIMKPCAYVIVPSVKSRKTK